MVHMPLLNWRRRARTSTNSASIQSRHSSSAAATTGWDSCRLSNFCAGRELDLTALPPAAKDLQDMAADYHARPSYALSSGNSFPPDLLNRELADIWHKAPMHARHLRRLRKATPVAADPQLVSRIAS